ncbi:MAG: hypothetical protein BWY39_01424 [Spirochaetes bacterium ADurb.Bin269]|nr:MAG: hypothetical protein BWY39_01424 [Spirochaetes bacterium ADurb.Bin269]
MVWANPGFKFKGFEKTYEMYSNPDNDPRGDWRSDNLTLGFSYLERPNLYYPLYDPKTDIWYPANPDGVWRYATKTRLKPGQQVQAKPMEDFIELGQIRFPQKQRVETWNTKEELIQAIETGDVPRSGRNPLLRKELPDLDFWIGKKVGFERPQFKRYKADLRNENQPLSSWINSTIDKEEAENHIQSGTNQEGTKALQNLLGEKAFNYTKPPSLLKGLLSQSTGPDDLVLDFLRDRGRRRKRSRSLTRKTVESAPAFWYRQPRRTRTSRTRIFAAMLPRAAFQRSASSSPTFASRRGRRSNRDDILTTPQSGRASSFSSRRMLPQTRKRAPRSGRAKPTKLFCVSPAASTLRYSPASRNSMLRRERRSLCFPSSPAPSASASWVKPVSG